MQSYLQVFLRVLLCTSPNELATNVCVRGSVQELRQIHVQIFTFEPGCSIMIHKKGGSAFTSGNGSQLAITSTGHGRRNPIPPQSLGQLPRQCSHSSQGETLNLANPPKQARSTGIFLGHDVQEANEVGMLHFSHHLRSCSRIQRKGLSVCSVPCQWRGLVLIGSFSTYYCCPKLAVPKPPELLPKCVAHHCPRPLPNLQAKGCSGGNQVGSSESTKNIPSVGSKHIFHHFSTTIHLAPCETPARLVRCLVHRVFF